MLEGCVLEAAQAPDAGAIRTKRNTPILLTPSLHVPGFEDEDEYETPHEWHQKLVQPVQ